MNNKGFTMIELLASMVLLSILMLVAVPTVFKTMDTSRRTTVVSDAKRLVSAVEYKLRNNNNYIKRPKSTSSSEGNCILVTLGYLDLGADFKEGPHGGLYLADESYVVVKFSSYNPQQYTYYVTLVESYDEKAYYGIYLLPYSKLISKNAKNYVDGFNSNKFLNGSFLSGSASVTGGGNLGCNKLENVNDRSTDKIYDSDDALREQGGDRDALGLGD